MNIQERYEEVKRFNDIAGNLSNVTVEKLEAQMKVFIEESKETADAFDNKDAVELLDGICDSFVTLAGLMMMAERMGFKVDEALKRVNRNNIEKFPERFISDEDHEFYKSQGWRVDFHMGYECCIIKDQNGKIRKPVGFKPVKIADLTPDIFSVKMTWAEALEKIKGTSKYIVQDNPYQKMQYLWVDGKINWTHFGSVGGVMNTGEITQMLANPNVIWTIKDSPYGGAA